MMSHIEKALKYLGMDQRTHRKELQELLGIDPVKLNWCSAFITSIEKKSGRNGTGSLAARSYLKYGTETKSPKEGDIVVFWRVARNSWQGHVGYYIDEDKNRILVLGGNQDKSVKYKWYSKSRLLSYRRPV